MFLSGVFIVSALLTGASACECGLSTSQRATMLSQLQVAREELVVQERRLDDLVRSSCSSDGDGIATATPPVCTVFNINGYTPLYDTQACANSASPDGTSHGHEFEGVMYYMPNGVPFSHGDATTTAAAATTTTPSPSPSSASKNEKRGIAMNNLGAILASSASSAAVALGTTPISWTYNWAAKASSPIAQNEASANSLTSAGISFFPMAWGSDPFHDLDLDLATIVDGGAPEGVILGFNEPNHRSQANLSPQEAAALWPKLEAAAASTGATTLVGPAVNWSPDAPWQNPWDWYAAFFEAYPGARVDALAFHSYNCNSATMRYYVSEYKSLLERYGRSGTPLWLTEFSCADDPQQISGNSAGSKDWRQQCNYIRDVVPYLDSEPAIAKYAWFSHDMEYTGEVALVDAEGALTELGRCYVEE